MRNIKPEETVMTTNAPFDILSHEKAVVRLDAGCAWVYLTDNGERVGVAFAGPSRYIVDAIVETSKGAVGQTKSSALKGVQIYLGKTEVEKASQPSTADFLGRFGYNDAAAFLNEVRSVVEKHLEDGHKIVVKGRSSSVLLGTTEDDRSVVIATKPESLAFVQDKRVFIDGEGRSVSVSKSGIVIRRQDGRAIVLGRDKIPDLEWLREIGPMVSDKVSRAMRGLGHIRGFYDWEPSAEHSHCSCDDDESDEL
ncbi:MAG: hypothetical protein C4K49_12760 [Candidatus Thorarchaeota archaeon]|nr:MAG: hypothetical protein C4K49_12760 [Candidatus Thorarchaeota archaeon]